MRKEFKIYPQNKNRTKKIWPKILLLVLILFLLLVAGLVVSLFQASNSLMNKPGKEYNPIASHLMPRYEQLIFNPQKSDLPLYGWYFPHNDNFRGNVIFIHHNGADKLQYDLDTADLFSFLVNEGFNVFAIDLRHSGQSGGKSSAYGYAEYRDILGAMNIMYKMSGRKDFILYGIGSGTSASLFAWESLPEMISEKEKEEARPDDPLLTKQDIVGFILDTPPASAYDYIRLDLQDNSFLQKNFYSRFIPDIVRLSSNGPDINNLIPLVSHVEVPVMITRNIPDTVLGQVSCDAFISECVRIKPETSFVTETSAAGHLDGFLKDKQDYLDDLEYFLDIWF